MLSGEEYARLELNKKLLLKEYGYEYRIPTRLYSNCKYMTNNAFSIDVDGFCNSCTGTSGGIKNEFTEEYVTKKNNLVLRDKCLKCNVLPLCLGGCSVQNKLGYSVCVTEKYFLDEILYEYVKG